MWMKFLEDYDFTLHYHPGKENMVADPLSHKSRGGSGRCSRLWDSSGYNTMSRLRVRWGV